MKYLLLGDDTKTLFIENDDTTKSIFYDAKNKKWRNGGTRLWDARVGFDPSEPEDSPYRYGNSSCMLDIIEISKEKAEEFMGKKINEAAIKGLLKRHHFE